MLLKVNKSLNFSKKPRSLRAIRYLIIHYSGMQSGRVSMDRLKNPKSKVSCHYFIERRGNIYRMVEDNKIAWHAGKSKWKDLKNLNKCSIGIEIQNKGHFINYQNFSKKQISSLIRLIKVLMKKYKIKKRNILGHSDIAPLRKLDPGEKFPWNFLSKKGVAIWYPKNRLQIYDTALKIRRKIFFRNIYKIGYRFFNLSKKSNKDRKIIMAFQRRFLPKEINGKITDKTLKISQLLS
jgi:N-acetylmuramoyl-L-alanine amidase|tara:strand:+ start:3351 stop:4058 length:708 start_codon:yes stop_codon:yes gene_type:complete